MSSQIPIDDVDLLNRVNALNIQTDQVATIANRILNMAKRHARYLQQKPSGGLGHRALLEKMAIACGRPNWHAFTQELKSIAEESRLPVPPIEKFLHQFEKAFPLLMRLRDNRPPSEVERNSLIGFAKVLALTIPMRFEDVLDVLADIHVGKTWEALLAIEEVKALYSFRVGSGSDARFQRSEQCVEILETLYQLEEKYMAATGLRKQQFKIQILTMIETWPDFLDGLSVAGRIQAEEGDIDSAIGFFEAGIRHAEALIPKGFRGQTSWYEHGDRPYLLMLYELMRIYCYEGWIDEAYKLAKKQLSRNPNDNLGVRYILPILQMIQGKRTGGPRSSRQWKIELKTMCIETHLTESLCNFIQSDVALGQKHLLVALFCYPGLRDFLYVDNKTKQLGEAAHRGVIPNAELVDLALFLIEAENPHTFSSLKNILASDIVKYAEAELDTIHSQIAKRRDQGLDIGPAIDLWKSEVKRFADMISAMRADERTLQ